MCIDIANIHLHTFFVPFLFMHFCTRCKFLLFSMPARTVDSMIVKWLYGLVWSVVCYFNILCLLLARLEAQCCGGGWRWRVVGIGMNEKRIFVYVRIFKVWWWFGVWEGSNRMICRWWWRSDMLCNRILIEVDKLAEHSGMMKLRSSCILCTQQQIHIYDAYSTSFFIASVG